MPALRALYSICRLPRPDLGTPIRSPPIALRHDRGSAWSGGCSRAGWEKIRVKGVHGVPSTGAQFESETVLPTLRRQRLISVGFVLS
jgi:hypothetical protein